MMTGQITGGADAMHAAQYQIIIMYLLMAANCVSGIVSAKVAAAAVLFQERLNI